MCSTRNYASAFSFRTCWVQGAGFRVQGSGFRVQGTDFRFQGPGLEDRVEVLRLCLLFPHLRYRGTSLIKNSTPPYDHHRDLDIGLLEGPRGALFLMSEV